MLCAYRDFSLELSTRLFLSFPFAFCPMNKAKPENPSIAVQKAVGFVMVWFQAGLHWLEIFVLFKPVSHPVYTGARVRVYILEISKEVLKAFYKLLAIAFLSTGCCTSHVWLQTFSTCFGS